MPDSNLTPKQGGLKTIGLALVCMEIYSICILKPTKIFTELSLSMFTVGGNSLSGKIHPGQETDEIIFTFQLRGNLTAPFSQLTLR